MGGIDGDAQADQFILVDLVAAALGERLTEAHNLDTGLEGVVGGDEAHVPPADDEEPSGRAHQVPVHQRLEGPGAVDAGEGVAPEHQRLLSRAGRDQRDMGAGART